MGRGRLRKTLSAILLATVISMNTTTCHSPLNPKAKSSSQTEQESPEDETGHEEDDDNTEDYTYPMAAPLEPSSYQTTLENNLSGNQAYYMPGESPKLAWNNPNSSTKEHILFYRTRGSGQYDWMFLGSTSQRSYQTENLNTGDLEFAVLSVDSMNNESELHTSLDSTALPGMGWYIVRRYHPADTNNDGTITSQETKAFMDLYDSGDPSATDYELETLCDIYHYQE